MIWARPYRRGLLKRPDNQGLLGCTFASLVAHTLILGLAFMFGWRGQPLISPDVPFVEVALEDVGIGRGTGADGAGYYVGRARRGGGKKIGLGKLPGSTFSVKMKKRKVKVEREEGEGEPDSIIGEELKERTKQRRIRLSEFKPVSLGLTGRIGKSREKESLELAIYKAQVLAAIKGRWAYAGGIANGLWARVVIEVTRSGGLLGVRLARSSGNPLFDASVTKAVKAAVPLPPFPAIFNKDKETILLEFRSEERG